MSSVLTREAKLHWKGIFGVFGRMRLTMLLGTVCCWLDISCLVYNSRFRLAIVLGR